jgi:hypothetical protein
MYSSRWNYVLAGMSMMGAVLGALVRNSTFLFVNFIFAIFNWYLAEHKRHIEEENLIAEAKAQNDSETKNQE